MKRMIFFIFSICSCVALFSQQLHSYNKAIIWRGFQHQWTYNHRCSRLGDYVQFNSGTPISVHTSATGIGADSTYFSSYYTYVASPDVVFKEGDTTIKIHTKEKRLIEKTIGFSVNADKWLQGKTDYITLINGFDLRSDHAADKIQLLRFSIEDGEYDSVTNEIHFNANISLVLNCQSIECPELNNKVIYDLDIHYLIVGLNKGEAAATEQFFTRSYSWDKKEELDEQPEKKIITGDVFPSFAQATVGIKSFSFALNEAHWMLAMNNNINPFDYDSTSSRMKLSVDLLFKEWQEGMKGSDAAPKQSKFSSKRKGWAVMDIDAVLLQLKTAKIIYGKHQGQMFWRNSIGTPYGNNAKQISDIQLE